MVNIISYLGEKHSFKIIAHNYGSCSPSNPAGLIYALVQDFSSNPSSNSKINTIILQSNTQKQLSSVGSP